MYVNDLFKRLRKAGYGCNLFGVYAGAFGYADDLSLLSPSVYSMYRILNIYESYALEHRIKFNGKKSKLICFPNCDDPKFTLLGELIPQYSKVLHLGHSIVSDIMYFDSKLLIANFYKKVNIFISNFKGLIKSSHAL